MSRFWRLCLLGFALLPADALAAPFSRQAALDSFAKNLGYQYTILSNKVTDGCPNKPGQPYCYSATLDLTMPKTMPMILQWDESFDIGSDTLTGVNDEDYKPPFKLTAKLNKLTIKVDRPQLSEKDIKELEKKMREKDLAMTRRTPAPIIAVTACSRDEPQPRFQPPTTTPPAMMRSRISGPSGSKRWRA